MFSLTARVYKNAARAGTVTPALVLGRPLLPTRGGGGGRGGVLGMGEQKLASAFWTFDSSFPNFKAVKFLTRLTIYIFLRTGAKFVFFSEKLRVYVRHSYSWQLCEMIQVLVLQVRRLRPQVPRVSISTGLPPVTSHLRDKTTNHITPWKTNRQSRRIFERNDLSHYVFEKNCQAHHILKRTNHVTPLKENSQSHHILRTNDQFNHNSKMNHQSNCQSHHKQPFTSHIPNNLSLKPEPFKLNHQITSPSPPPPPGTTNQLPHPPPLTLPLKIADQLHRTSSSSDQLHHTSKTNHQLRHASKRSR